MLASTSERVSHRTLGKSTFTPGVFLSSVDVGARCSRTVCSVGFAQKWPAASTLSRAVRSQPTAHMRMLHVMLLVLHRTLSRQDKRLITLLGGTGACGTPSRASQDSAQTEPLLRERQQRSAASQAAPAPLITAAPEGQVAPAVQLRSPTRAASPSTNSSHRVASPQAQKQPASPQIDSLQPAQDEHPKQQASPASDHTRLLSRGHALAEHATQASTCKQADLQPSWPSAGPSDANSNSSTDQERPSSQESPTAKSFLGDAVAPLSATLLDQHKGGDVENKVLEDNQNEDVGADTSRHLGPDSGST